MKKLLLLFVLIQLIIVSASAQQASDYFPSQTGFKWEYSSTPLDSINNPIDSLTFFRIDSFSVVDNYKGKLANIVLTKSGTIGAIHNLPFLDSLFYYFNQDTAYEYTHVGTFASILLSLDSLQIDTNFSFFNFFKSLEDWYPAYRFNSPQGQEYTIFSIDTSINYNSQNIPLRFEYFGKRFADQTIQTEIGTFTCKKFLVERGVSYLIIFPPLPPLAVPIAYAKDTLWLAEDNWTVKSFIPSIMIDLSFAGGPSFFIPGLKTEVLDEITEVKQDNKIPTEFSLYQNYPNPFNPNTKIKFQISSHRFVSLKVYDILGNEVATLVNEELSQGEYEIDFQSSISSRQLASGIYFYQLKTGSFIETRKMILMK